MFPDQNVLNILMVSVIKLITVEEQKSGAQSFQIGRETNDRHLFLFWRAVLRVKVPHRRINLKLVNMSPHYSQT